MLSLIRNISRKCVETLEALTDKALVTVLRSPELKQNFLQTTGIYIYIYIYKYTYIHISFFWGGVRGLLMGNILLGCQVYLSAEMS